MLCIVIIIIVTASLEDYFSFKNITYFKKFIYITFLFSNS